MKENFVDGVDIKRAAKEAREHLENAVGDLGYLNTENDMFLEDEWQQKLDAAKKYGVQDLSGWLADSYYDDQATVSDIIGDKISDLSKNSKEAFIAICKEIQTTAHKALYDACQEFIDGRR